MVESKFFEIGHFDSAILNFKKNDFRFEISDHENPGIQFLSRKMKNFS